jgi:hypothetical protein
MLAVKPVEQYSLPHKLSLGDALALCHDMERYSLNRKDFVFIPGLRLFRP